MRSLLVAGTVLVATLTTFALGAPAAGARGAPVTPTAETDPVAHSGDAADDPAIWVHPADPGASVVIGNDKGGALEVYDLSGNRLQRIAVDGFFGNVDVRQGLRYGQGRVDLVGLIHSGMTYYQLDPATRRLTNITEGGRRPIGVPGEGFCLYRSPVSGTLHAFVIGRDGRVEQHKVGDRNWDGRIDSYLVRTFDVGSEAEGCVADDEAGLVYISEEDVGIWKYDAEPTAPAEPSLVDSAGAGGNLRADVEGLTLTRGPDGAGYLIASAQNVEDPRNSYFTVYQRRGSNAYVGSFRVESGTAADGCSRTDGVAAHRGNLGPSFPQGLFVCQDHENTGPGTSGNQNFKLVPLESL